MLIPTSELIFSFCSQRTSWKLSFALVVGSHNCIILFLTLNHCVIVHRVILFLKFLLIECVSLPSLPVIFPLSLRGNVSIEGQRVFFMAGVSFSYIFILVLLC